MVIHEEMFEFSTEMQFFHHLHDINESFVAFYPQLHVKFSTSLKIQIGIGIYCKRSKIVPQFAHKVILMAPAEQEEKKELFD